MKECEMKNTPTYIEALEANGHAIDGKCSLFIHRLWDNIDVKWGEFSIGPQSLYLHKEHSPHNISL
jgi:hypothetical protein